VEERSGSRQQLFVVLDGLLVGPRRSGTGSGGLGVVAEGLVAVTAHVGQDGGAIHGPTHDNGLCSRQFSARCLSRLEGTRRMSEYRQYVETATPRAPGPGSDAAGEAGDVGPDRPVSNDSYSEVLPDPGRGQFLAETFEHVSPSRHLEAVLVTDCDALRRYFGAPQ
jgi:hypothetical protein